MSKQKKKTISINRELIGKLADSRATEDTTLSIERTRSATSIRIFGNENRAALAFFISDLLVKGYDDAQILDIINTKYDLQYSMKSLQIFKKLIRTLWRTQMVADMNEQIMQEVMAINTQLNECWRAWEFSKKDVKSKTMRKTDSEGNADELTFSQKEVILKEDTTAGDPKYMTLINELHKEKRKLLGLYAPEKKATSDRPTAVQINVVGGAGEATSQVLQSVLTPKTEIMEGDAEVVEETNVLPQETIQQHTDGVNIDELLEDLMGDE